MALAIINDFPSFAAAARAKGVITTPPVSDDAGRKKFDAIAPPKPYIGLMTPPS